LNSIHNKSLASIKTVIVQPKNIHVLSSVFQNSEFQPHVHTRNFNDNPLNLTKKQFRTRLALENLQAQDKSKLKLDQV